MTLSYHRCQTKLARLYVIIPMHERIDCACEATHSLHVEVHQEHGGWLQVCIKIHTLGRSIL